MRKSTPLNLNKFMKLRDMYGQFVARTGPVLNVSFPKEINFVKERDPKNVALENAVNAKMNQAIEQATPKQKKLPEPVDKIRIVSYEEAVKELSNTLKPTNNKS